MTPAVPRRFHLRAAAHPDSCRRRQPAPQLLTNVGQLERDTTASVVNHYNVQPLYDVYANVQDRDLGAVASDVDRVLR